MTHSVRPTAALSSPSAASSRGAGARRTRAALVTAGAVAGVLLTGLPASAHDRLVSSDPGDGEVLTEVPAEAVLTFSSQVQELGTVLELHDEAGQVVSEAPTQVEGRDVLIAVPADLGAGDYAVVYRVTSSDGHPISGEVPFTLDVVAPAPTTPAPTTPAPTTRAPTAPAPSPGSAPTTPPAAGAVDGSDAESASTEVSAGVPWAALGVVAVLVVLAGVAAALLARRRRPRTR